MASETQVFSKSNQMASETPQVRTSIYPNSYMEKYGHIVDLYKDIEYEHQHVLSKQPLYPPDWSGSRRQCLGDCLWLSCLF